MTTVKAQDLVGQTVLGRYRIVRRLARGGMGAVYLGRTEGAAGFARPVVIKRVLPSLMDDDEVAQMFVREAQVLSNLQHPNIVTVLDFGQQADGAYLMVLEYVHGFQLAQWSEYVQKTRGLLPVDFALYIVTRVLDALHYAHTFRRGDGKAMQIIHRDVSPSNVLLNAQADVKLLDFGIARVSGDETAFVTDRSQVKGKLPYLPLESFKGADPSVQSDVYSAGVMLYELLTGTNPFLGRETAEIYAKILEVVPKSVHASRDDAPEDIDAVLGKAMHKDAAQRYASAADFASALRALRSKPEEVLASTLAAALTQDFERALPELLKVETLAVRESAWRNPTETPKTDEIDELLLPQSRPDAGPEQVTVRAPIDRALIAATVVNTPAPAAPPAVTVRPGPPPVAPPPAAIVAPKPVAPAPRQASAPQPTAAATSPLPASPSPTPEAPAASTKRIGVVAALASAIGAAVVVGVWFAVQPNAQEQQVVVIRQEAHAGAAPAAATVPPIAAAATPPTPAVVAAAVPAPAAAPEPAPAAVDPAATAAAKAAPKAPEPNPKALTRTFGRRQSKVEACFVQHGSDVPGHPQLSIHFWVDDAGKVTNAEIEPASVRDSKLGQCLLNVAQATSFGPLQHGVSFHIPITAQAL